MLENGQKAHLEKFRLHWNSTTDWIVLNYGEVDFTFDDETEKEEQTAALYEGTTGFVTIASVGPRPLLRYRVLETRPAEQGPSRSGRSS